ncbi:hypothetical protein Tco_0283326, partial [Tanacetum coccineum]
MDPYEEVAQQGQAHPLSPAYVPDPIQLDKHVPVYVPEPEHPEYHAPSDDDIQIGDQPYADAASPTAESPGYFADSDLMKEDTDADSIDYPDEREDGEEDDDEDSEEDLETRRRRVGISIEEVNLRVSYEAQVHRKESGDFYTQLLDAQTDRRDIRLEIDVVRGQRTAYEIELHEVRQAY